MAPKPVNLLKNCLEKDPNVELAFMFGSSAKGKEMKESDIDVAVYLKDKKKENAVWLKAQKVLKKELDLVLLNDAPATLVSNVFKTGIPLTIKNKKLYWGLYLEKTMEAEDFSEFAADYWKISQRSKQLEEK